MRTRLLPAIVGLGIAVGCKPEPKPEEGPPPEAKPQAEEEAKDQAELPPEAPEASRAELAAARKRYLEKLNEGRALTKQEKYAEGIALYREALEVDPDDATLLGELGWAAFLSGDLPLARRTTNMALRYAASDRQRGMLLYNLGRVAEQEGMPELAAEHYRASLERRENETVKKRLASLKVAAANERHGIDFVAEGLADLDAVCTELRTRCDEVVLFDPEEHCKCEVVADVEEGEGEEKTKALLFRLGDPGAWDGTNFTLHLALVADDGSLSVTEFVGWSYNPGAFGIWESLEEPKLSAKQLLPGARPELVLEMSKSRFDRDMGINEVEDEASRTVVACAIVEGKPRCTQPMVRSYSYSREVEFEDEDEDIEHTEGLPLRRSYEAVIELREDGTVEVRAEGAQDQGGFFDGHRLPAGEHRLLDLL